MRKKTYTQTGGAGTATEIDANYLNKYTVHQIQVSGLSSSTAVIAAQGPADTFTDSATLSNNDIYFLEGIFDALRVTWGGSSGGSLSIRSYNLAALDGGR